MYMTSRDPLICVDENVDVSGVQVNDRMVIQWLGWRKQ
jgi:hypothetical protein